MSTSWSIRPATEADRPILSHICLLTGDAGQSGESQYHFTELLGLLYAESYVVIPPWFGFVLTLAEPNEQEQVVGYVLGTPDTRAFESALEREWYPQLRSKYPKVPYPEGATSSDKQMIDILHTSDTTPEEIIALSRSHIHINLLPRAQGQGWGTKMINQAVQYLESHGCDSLFVGIDPRNDRARGFYKAIGFEGVHTAHGEYYRLDFSKWKYR